MQIRTEMTVSAGALLIATTVWSGPTSAQTSSFQPLQPGSAHFQIIAGGSAPPKTPIEAPAAKPTRRTMATPAAVPATAVATTTSVTLSASPPSSVTAAADAAPLPIVAAALAAPSAPEAVALPPPAALDSSDSAPMPEPVAQQAAAPPRKVQRPDAIVTASITPAPVRHSEVVQAGDENVRLVRRGNALVDEATRRARDSLDLFVRAANNPPEGAGDFAVKVTLGPKDSRETVWVSALERRMTRRFLILTSERWSGRLSNEPTQSIGHKIGDRVSFSASEIRDWTYRLPDGRMLGNFTACALTAQEGPGKLAELVEKTRLDCEWIAEATRVAAR